MYIKIPPIIIDNIDNFTERTQHVNNIKIIIDSYERVINRVSKDIVKYTH